MKRFAALFLVLMLSLTCLAGCGNSYSVEADSVENVILFIGDGMGENHLKNTLTYFEMAEPSFMADKCGSIATRSSNRLVTDSAAAATAMATGQKVKNGEISQHRGEDIQTIVELAKRAGKKVGIITTDHLDGATPAAFSAHAADRGDREDIARSQAVSGVDLFIGEAESDYSYYNDFHSVFEENGYTFVTSETDLNANKKKAKLVATLPEVRSEYNDGNSDDYQLDEMVKFAMTFLENDNGYFLMVESAHIDKFSHDNQIVPALCEVRSMIDAITYVYGEISESPVTALIVTADHETGKLELAESKADIANKLYKSEGHTSRDVPVYSKNAKITFNGTLQNTVIFDICNLLLLGN